MRAQVLFCILSLVGIAALAQPAFYFTQQDMQRAVTSATLLPEGMLLACLADGTCLILDPTGSVIWSHVFVGFPVERILVAGSLAYLVDSSGTLHTLNVSSLREISSRKFLKQGEVGVKYSAVSGDGRFLAVAIRYYPDTSSKYSLDRLVVYTLNKGERVFERDAFSPAVLVKVFSLDIWGDFLITETLNVSCHLCELTDNVVEVYRLGSKVQKVSERQTGLSRVKSISGGYLLVQRVQDNSLLLLSLPDLGLVAEKKDMPPMRQAVPLEDGFLLVSEEYDLWRCSLALNCHKLSSLPPMSLVARLGSYLVVFSVPEVRVLLLEGERVVHVISYEVQWDIAPSPPSLVLAGKNSAAALYPSRKLAWLRLLDRSKLLVRVLDPEGRPVAGATVRVVSEDFFKIADTGTQGEVVLDVRPGSYTVEVTKEGFSLWIARVKVDTPYYNLIAVLSRVSLEKGVVTLRVVDPRGNPIAGALVSFEGVSTASAFTNEQGYASLELPVGEYKLEVRAPGYRGEKTHIKIHAVGTNATITLEPQASQVSFIVEGAETVGLEVSSGTMTTRFNLSGTLSLSLERGLYSFYVYAPGYVCRSNVSSPIFLSGDGNLTVRVVCESVKPSQESSAERVVEELSSRVLSHRRINVSAGSMQVTLMNGSVVDLAALSLDKTVVVEFFYTQCSGCRDILPALRRISAMSGTLVVSLTVSPYDDHAALSAYIRENNVTWPVGRTPPGILQKLNISSYPTVVVLSNGVVIFIGIGAKPEEPNPEDMFPPTADGLSGLLGAIAELYTPAMLITLGLLLSAVALLIGGGHAEEEAEASITSDTTALPAFNDSIRGYYSEAVSLYTHDEEQPTL